MTAKDASTLCISLWSLFSIPAAFIIGAWLIVHHDETKEVPVVKHEWSIHTSTPEEICAMTNQYKGVHCEVVKQNE